MLDADAAGRARTLLRLDRPPAPAVAGPVIEAQRHALLALFDEGRISDAVMRRLQRELDLQAALLA
jgi:hypothetical protein